ncbi:MAG: hypothetical protein WCL16_12425 [bacterium]
MKMLPAWKRAFVISVLSFAFAVGNLPAQAVANAAPAIALETPVAAHSGPSIDNTNTLPVLAITPDAMKQTPWTRFYNQHIARRLEVGTRVTYFMLEDVTRGADNHFYGSIDKLDATQDLIPYKLFADYLVSPYWGFDLTWDDIQSDTITTSDGHNDGQLVLWGPMLSAFARYPNQTRFTPSAGAGVTYLFADFQENPEWMHPATNPGIDFQTFSPDNTFGWLVYVNLATHITGHWYADLYLRHLGADVQGVHSLKKVGEDFVHHQGDFNFPVSNDAVGIGVRYAF